MRGSCARERWIWFSYAPIENPRMNRFAPIGDDRHDDLCKNSLSERRPLVANGKRNAHSSNRQGPTSPTFSACRVERCFLRMGKRSAYLCQFLRRGGTERRHTHDAVKSPAKQLLVFVVPVRKKCVRSSEKCSHRDLVSSHGDDDQQLGLAVVQRRPQEIVMVVELVRPAGDGRVATRRELVRVLARQEAE